MSCLNDAGSAIFFNLLIFRFSSETLNLLTLPAHSVTVTEFESDNDSERDGEEDDDVSENDLEILGELSCQGLTSVVR